MNAKKAKLLRRVSREAAVEKDGSAMAEVRHLELTNKRKYQLVEKLSGDGKSTYTDKILIAAGTIKVDPSTVRGVYKHVKKSFVNHIKSK